MGIRLVGECAKKFAHLNANPYKALIWMCYRTLDDPNPKKAIPAGLWFADWPELAQAIGWQVPTDSKGRDRMRNDVSKVCRELVAAGAIEKRPHPQGLDNAAYSLVLVPKPIIPKARKRSRRTVPEAVDNLLILDFGTVDVDNTPQGENHPGGEGENHPGGEGENHPGGEGENHPGGEGENHPGPIKRNQEPTEEGVEEGVEEKGEDDSDRRDQPPDRGRPVDNPAGTSGWIGALGKVRDAMAASTSTPPRHARPTPAPVGRTDRE